MSGTVGDVKVFVFKNDRKTSDNQPDYQLAIGKKEERSEQAPTFDDTPDRGGALT